MIISASSLSKSFGENLLFENGQFNLEKGEKVGLIGRNGAGKTTLFEMIKGREVPSSGGFSRKTDLRLGYLEQFVCRDGSKTAFEEVLSIFEELLKIENELEIITSELQHKTDNELIEKQAILTEKFSRDGGLTFRARVNSALSGLGFSEEEKSLPVLSLSGGQRSKLGLIKLLLAEPELMLLDEPTNHLDTIAAEWLEDFILKSRSAAIIISHDRFFLDKVTTKTMEIENGHLYFENGNSSRYFELKEAREEAERREYENTMREVHRIEGIIEQQRRWNREKNIKTAESKEKQIERMLKDLKTPESEQKQLEFSFKPLYESGFDVLDCEHLSCSYDGKILYNDISFSIKKEQRAFILGRNGCGKTTLIKEIIDKGDGIEFGARVDVGYFSQHQDTLNVNYTIFEQLRHDHPSADNTVIRTALARFFFYGDDVFKNIGTLSGGERSRVALCSLMLKKCNLLLLDEPTNHLDIYCRNALCDALKSYSGTLLIISHDRFLINELATNLFVLENGNLTKFSGNYSCYKAYLDSKSTEKAEKKEIGKGGKEYQKRKADASKLRKLKSDVRKSEAEIERLENLIFKLNEELGTDEISSDYKKTLEKSDEISNAEADLNNEMQSWEFLCAQLEDIQ